MGKFRVMGTASIPFQILSTWPGNEARVLDSAQIYRPPSKNVSRSHFTFRSGFFVVFFRNRWVEDYHVAKV